ncbi:hypothetical protein AYO45_06000 [Gammaproteobacteria bacterium SCGC AG-212-F23]|nr:hypothetical protein AYO45_06000 [Gammaproteobacteria bacterium SCGC AG-212-F23]
MELLTPLFSTEWGRRGSYAAVVLAGLLLLSALIQTVTEWYNDVGLVFSSPKSVTLSDSLLQQVAEIPNMHLFGQYGVENGFLPVTALQIHLVGVLKATPEEASRVIISEAGKPGRVYQVGDVLESGVRIEAITDDGVILENAGHMEKLPLQRPALLFQGKPKALLQEEE